MHRFHDPHRGMCIHGEKFGTRMDRDAYSILLSKGMKRGFRDSSCPVKNKCKKLFRHYNEVLMTATYLDNVYRIVKLLGASQRAR
jgi:hypothetical protein